MPPTELPAALCVSLHDVAPATWPQCLRWLQAIWSVADIPLTLLVVPAYHQPFPPLADSRDDNYASMLDDLLLRGIELALHGYTHIDDGPPAQGLRNRFWRHVFTQQEGEFSALDAEQARRRLQLGLDWFAQHGWPVAGFVAPAWLLSDASWQALQDLPLQYTTTLGYFHLLPERRALFAPSLMYTARNQLGRALSPRAGSLLAATLHRAPLIRLGLHPRDAEYPALVLHTQRLLEKLLASRQAMTKAGFASQWRQVSKQARPWNDC